MPQPVVKLSSPTDIVGALPYRMGFRATESIVVMCLRGPRKRVGLVMRHDLVPPEYEAQLVDVVSSHVRRDGAAAVIVVIYTEAPDSEGELPRRAFVDALVDALPADAMEILLVRDGRWWSYRCSAPCCPPEGTPIPVEPEGAVGVIAAELVGEGRAVLPDRAALEGIVEPKRGPLSDAGRAQAFDVALESIAATACEHGPDHLRKQTVELLTTTARRWAEGSRDLDRVDAARIVLGLRDKLARDHAATIALDVDPELYLPLLIELCRHAEALDAAPVCTVLAWVAYLRGDGALANVALDRALRCEPDYEMAQLLITGLEGQVPPSEVRKITQLTREDLEALERGEDPRRRRGEGPRRPRGEGPRRRRGERTSRRNAPSRRKPKGSRARRRRR